MVRRESLRSCASVNQKWPPKWCHWRTNVRTMISDTIFSFQFNQLSLPQLRGNHWCYALIYYTFSYFCTHIVHWTTNNTDLKWTKFSLSEQTAHCAIHDMLGGITKIPVPLWGTQLRQLFDTWLPPSESWVGISEKSQWWWQEKHPTLCHSWAPTNSAH